MSTPTDTKTPEATALRSEKFRLADTLLAQHLTTKREEAVPLDRWILDLRAAGRSDRDISDRLLAATGVYASHETIRTWFPHADATSTS
jgi:hypothetical protein